MLPALLTELPSTLPPQNLKKGCSLAAFGVCAKSTREKLTGKGHADTAELFPRYPSAKRMFITRWGDWVKLDSRRNWRVKFSTTEGTEEQGVRPGESPAKTRVKLKVKNDGQSLPLRQAQGRL